MLYYRTLYLDSKRDTLYVGAMWVIIPIITKPKLTNLYGMIIAPCSLLQTFWIFIGNTGRNYKSIYMPGWWPPVQALHCYSLWIDNHSKRPTISQCNKNFIASGGMMEKLSVWNLKFNDHLISEFSHVHSPPVIRRGSTYTLKL